MVGSPVDRYYGLAKAALDCVLLALDFSIVHDAYGMRYTLRERQFKKFYRGTVCRLIA